MNSVFEQSQAYKALTSPRFLRLLALWTLALFCTTVVALIFVPWQQTVIGTGKVTVFSPMHRPQSIEAQLAGRIVNWHVVEGQSVRAGQVIVTLADIDPKFMGTQQVAVVQQQRQALLNRKTSAQSRLSALQGQWQALTQSRQAALPTANERFVQSSQRILVAQQAVTAAQQSLATAQVQYQRLQELFQKGLRSQRDLELAELDKVRAQTVLEQAQAQLDLAQRDRTVSAYDQTKVSGDTAASLASVSAAIASAQETIASADAELAKLQVDLDNLKQRVALRQVRSPMTGRVVRLIQTGRGETVLEGDLLATVVPKTQDQAVELYVSSWDVPLITEGRLVRLQFSGWPAIQFAGWPMVATGTFGGRVSVIDAVDDGKGRYRLLIRPDSQAIVSGKDQRWPSPKYLRPGTDATGWILLDTVPLGYELWRQFNAFPPSLKLAPEDEETKADTKDKPKKRKIKT